MASCLELENGDVVHARSVVVAAGIGPFRSLPTCLSGLTDKYVSHSYDHRDLADFTSRRVAVIGAGASAIDLAGLLCDRGCDATLIYRGGTLKFGSVPSEQERSLWQRVRHPGSGLGPGLRSRFYAEAPSLFHLLPQSLRLSIVRNHLGPAASWRMKGKVDGRVTLMGGYEPAGAAMTDKKVELTLRALDGRKIHALFDHVIAATGYRIGLRRLEFIDQTLRTEVECIDETPVLSTRFEFSARGLFFIGPAAANSFGPLMRFVFGAGFAAGRLAGVFSSRQKNVSRSRADKAEFSHSSDCDARAMRPRVLLLQSHRWPNAAHLAIAFRKAGFVVESVAPAGHPLHDMRSSCRTFVYRPTSPRKSIQRAIEAAQPQLIIPCDDRALGHLHALHEESKRIRDITYQPPMSALIETSLGSPESFGLLRSRLSLSRVLGLPGVNVPRTDRIASLRQLLDWVKLHGLPAVLKLDGSWGGQDVFLLRDHSAIGSTFHKMQLRQSLLRPLKAALTKGDVEPLFSYARSPTPIISAQSFVNGRASQLRGCMLARGRSGFGRG